MSSTCQKSKEGYHTYINFVNKSDKVVVFGLRATYKGLCRIDGKNSTYKFRPYKSYIEDNLIYEEPLEIYIVDSSKFNEPYVFYDCDSIYIKNDILKCFSLTLDDLKQSDFTITYP